MQIDLEKQPKPTSVTIAAKPLKKFNSFRKPTKPLPVVGTSIINKKTTTIEIANEPNGDNFAETEVKTLVKENVETNNNNDSKYITCGHTSDYHSTNEKDEISSVSSVSIHEYNDDDELANNSSNKNIPEIGSNDESEDCEKIIPNKDIAAEKISNAEPQNNSDILKISIETTGIINIK